jgi:hypothetical protein
VVSLMRSVHSYFGYFIPIIKELKDSWVLGKGDYLSGRALKLSFKTILAYCLR